MGSYGTYYFYSDACFLEYSCNNTKTEYYNLIFLTVISQKGQY